MSKLVWRRTNSIKAEVHGLFNKSMRKYDSSASVKIDLTTNSDFAAETKSIGGIGADTGKIGKVGITYFKEAFLSNYALGKAILYEYYRVADYYSGRATIYFLNYRKKYYAPKSAILLKDHIEIRAYKFIFDLGDSSSVYKK